MNVLDMLSKREQTHYLLAPIMVVSVLVMFSIRSCFAVVLDVVIFQDIFIFVGLRGSRGM